MTPDLLFEYIFIVAIGIIFIGLGIKIAMSLFD